VQTPRHVELTVRGLLLGAAITLVFTAANVYLGLKVGLTFASSIPAAVISMAVLRAFKNATIFENNIVQTVASAAGTLSSIIFALPGLVMLGWWNGFPFWQSFGVCAVGGILGVMYTIPLRRALVTESDLPYPEGVAAAEVLRVGAGSREGARESRSGLIAVVGGSIASAAFAAVVAARIFIDEVDGFFRAGRSSTGIGVGLSLALVGAGHLVGLGVGLAMGAGLLIAWGAATPILTALHPMAGSAAEVATSVWKHQVRFLGAGTIGIAAIWTLVRLIPRVWRGVKTTISISRRMGSSETAGDVPREERDLPIRVVALICVFLVLPLVALLATFITGGSLAGLIVPIVVAAIAYIVVIGFLVAAVCGYMAGLIGSSNSPVSGLAILAVLGAALLLVLISHSAGPAAKPALTALSIFIAAIVLSVATIANDNLQDLKTGQLIGATPWRQQVALIVGVIMGALVIPPILNLLEAGYGFAGAPLAHPGAQPLPAPQATIITALASGVVSGRLDWGMIGIGALVGIGIILIDELLAKTTGYRLPPLAVGIGIYLPAGTTAAVVVGALAGWIYNRAVSQRADSEAARQLGVLLASGLIVGESLFGVLLSAIIVVSNKSEPLALVGDSFNTSATALGGVAFVLAILALYRWVGSLDREAIT
jgi:putative OPT family oligopeptide transporter